MNTERIDYDELGLFHENAEEYSIPYPCPPAVEREWIKVDKTRELSALRWGTEAPKVVFLHGGAQNAHTWDTVVLAMNAGRTDENLPIPALCIDLPGHGHSSSAAPHDPAITAPLQQNAADLARVIGALAPSAEIVVGMSLGGLHTIALARDWPDLVRRMALVDITPGVNKERTKQITDFVNGPATFPSFEELLERTIQFNPTRSVASLRRGILHNALQTAEGHWVWRYRRDDAPPLPEAGGEVQRPDTATLWDAIGAFDKPLLFVRGMRSQSVVGDEDEAELVARAPHARIEHFAEAGHSVQGDMPLELAALIREFTGL